MNGSTVDLPIGTGPRNWTALETLAEVSRQMVTSETHEGSNGADGISEPRADRLELQEQYTLENPPLSYEQRVQRDKKCKLDIYNANDFTDLSSGNSEGPSIDLSRPGHRL